MSLHLIDDIKLPKLTPSNQVLSDAWPFILFFWRNEPRARARIRSLIPERGAADPKRRKYPHSPSQFPSK